MLTMHRTERVNTDHVHKVRVAEQRAYVHSTQTPCWTCCKASLQRIFQSDNYCITCLTTLTHHQSDNITTSPVRQQHCITSQTTALVGLPVRQWHWLDHQSDNSTELAVRQWHWLDHPSDNSTDWITSQTMALDHRSDNGTGSPVRQRHWITSQTTALEWHWLDHLSDNGTGRRHNPLKKQLANNGLPSANCVFQECRPACPFTQCSVAA